MKNSNFWQPGTSGCLSKLVWGASLNEGDNDFSYYVIRTSLARSTTELFLYKKLIWQSCNNHSMIIIYAFNKSPHQPIHQYVIVALWALVEAQAWGYAYDSWCTALHKKYITAFSSMVGGRSSNQSSTQHGILILHDFT